MIDNINKDEIINYYDNCQVDYEIVWHLKNNMCMHYGYWDKQTPNLRSALNNMNNRVAEYGGVKQGQLVLDAGCGVGGSSIFLAKNFKCKTIGITLSEKQVRTCSENALKNGVKDQCSFQSGNYLAMDFPDNYFDVVWAIESVCYAYNKIDFLKEAYRVLKPGGKVIIADFYTIELATGSKEKELVDKWTKTWAIKSYASINSMADDFREAGFTDCRQKDVTDHVLKSIKRLYQTFYAGVVCTYVGQLIGLRNRTQTLNTWSTYYQYVAHKKGLWKYMFYYGVKPF